MRRLRKHIIILFLVSLISKLGLAQQTTPSQIIESIIESHLEKATEGTDVALIIEDLEYFAENPININACNADILSRLYLLNSVQINKLLEYIEKYGPAYSIYELQVIDGFTRENLEKLEAFIYFGEPAKTSLSYKEELKNAKHQLLLRSLGNLQQSRGYKPRDDGSIPFEGNRFRYYTRYNLLVSNKISAGFTAEKDPGESFFKGSNKHGFDFNSAYISANLNQRVEHITIGDYIIRAGQGLVIWQGYTSSKSEDILGISKTGQGIRGYTSVDENLYFRGAASSINFGKGKLSLFYSRKNADGNSEETDSTRYFTSLQTSGYHRTQSEIEDEKSIKTTNFGGLFTWNFKNLKLGATFSHQQFDKPYQRSTQLYNLYRFSGTKNNTAGIDYLFNKGKYQLFGEAAVSKSKGKAIVQGAVAHLNDQLSFSALFRHFDKNYHALWANTFAEANYISNESGLYFGVQFLAAKHISLRAYSDIYQSKWINYTSAGPAKNWDIFAQANVQLSQKTNFYARIKNEEKDQRYKEDKLYVNVRERVQKTRLHIQHQLNESILLKTRLEHVYFRGQVKENGFLIFQDIQYKSLKMPLNISARLAYFDTESYDSRIYAYENDILYTFSIPAYYGQGFRTYFNLKYTISKGIECWIKLANTHWTDRDIVGSGYNEIAGNNKTELKFQLRLKF